jgi:hypothetical protein
LTYGSSSTRPSTGSTLLPACRPHGLARRA